MAGPRAFSRAGGHHRSVFTDMFIDGSGALGDAQQHQQIFQMTLK